MELALFFKDSKIGRENKFIAATKSLVDKDGKPLMWEVRAVSTNEDERIREECTCFDAGTGRFRLDVGRYTAKLVAAAVVEPNLYNASLQNSYDVSTPEELIREMLDNPHEYAEFIKFVQRFGELDVTVTEKADDAKN